MVSLLTAAMSLAGLIFQASFYTVEETRYSSVATDVINISIVLPVLLWSMSMARRGKLIGLFYWPGALFIVIYHYLAYTMILLST